MKNKLKTKYKTLTNLEINRICKKQFWKKASEKLIKKENKRYNSEVHNKIFLIMLKNLVITNYNFNLSQQSI